MIKSKLRSLVTRNLRFLALASLMSVISSATSVLVSGFLGLLVSTVAGLIVLALVAWSIASIVVLVASLLFSSQAKSRGETARELALKVASLIVIVFAFFVGKWGGWSEYVILHKQSWEQQIVPGASGENGTPFAVFNAGGMSWASSIYVYDVQDDLSSIRTPGSSAISKLEAHGLGCADYQVTHLFSHWYHVGCGG
jgi:hypothetical protein